MDSTIKNESIGGMDQLNIKEEFYGHFRTMSEHVFANDFTVAVDEERISVTDSRNLVYYFGHPQGQRHYVTKARTTKITLWNVVQKSLVNAQFVGSNSLDLVLDFLRPTHHTQFLTEIHVLDPAYHEI